VSALRLSRLCFGVVAITVPGRTLGTFWTLAIALDFVNQVEYHVCAVGNDSSTFVLRLLQAAHARETRALFDCEGGASILGVAAGRRGRNERTASLAFPGCGGCGSILTIRCVALTKGRPISRAFSAPRAGWKQRDMQCLGSHFRFS